MIEVRTEKNEPEKIIESKQGLQRREIYLSVLAIVVTLALSIALIYFKDELMSLTLIGGYSLLGMLIISFLAGSTLSFIPVPVPYWLLLLTLPSVLAEQWGILAPVFIGLTSALGATLGHLPTFFIGYSGANLSRRVVSINIAIYNKVLNWIKKRGSWAAFFYSAMLNPFHVPMTLAIGALRYSPLRFFFFSLLGNMVKSLFLAFCGYFGLTSLFKFLGI